MLNKIKNNAKIIKQTLEYRLINSIGEFTCDEYKYLLNKDGRNICYISKYELTYELCKIAVINCSSCLSEIPYKFKTKELCEIAVNNSGCILNYVPKKFRTKKLCKLSIDKCYSCSIVYVPEKFKDELK